MLTQLIEDHQDREEPESLDALNEWMRERDELRYVKEYLQNYTSTIISQQIAI